MITHAWMSKKLDDGRIECTACYQVCKLRDGEHGLCGVRMVRDGELKLAVYGLAASIAVDPVEKKPLYHFLPSSDILSFGTVGCNFSCLFCQNADISQYPKEHNYEVYGRGISAGEMVATAKRFKCDSIAYTYNEPVVFFEYAYDTAKLAHEEGLRNVFVTSGYETHEALTKIRPYLDAANIDLKSFSDDFYRDVCCARLKPVLKCIEDAYTQGIWVEITTLVIEGLNDSDDEIRNIAKFIASIDKNIPLHLSAFHGAYKMKDRPRTSPETLERAYDIATAEGLNYVYLGNIADDTRLNTYCPKCGELLIRRAGVLGEKVQNTLDEGHCGVCGYKINGVWN